MIVNADKSFSHLLNKNLSRKYLSKKDMKTSKYVV